MGYVTRIRFHIIMLCFDICTLSLLKRITSKGICTMFLMHVQRHVNRPCVVAEIWIATLHTPNVEAAVGTKKGNFKKIKARFPAKIEWDLTNRPLGPVSCYIELLDTQVFFARSIQWRFLGQIWPWPLQFVQNQPRKVPTLQQNNQKIQSRGVPNNQNPWPQKKITKMISILLMEDILHQLRLVVFPLFTGFYTSQVVVWDFFHQQYHWLVYHSPGPHIPIYICKF